MTLTAAFTHQKPMAISSITNVMSTGPSSSASNLYSSDRQEFHCGARYNYHHHHSHAHNDGLVSLGNFTTNSNSARGHVNQPRNNLAQYAFSSLSSPESNESESSTYSSSRKNKDDPEIVSTGSSGDENMTSCMNDILVPALLSSSSTSSSSSSPSPSNSNSATLSLQERRQRNKTASAKYRAKKNQQHHEMRSVINTLTKENDVLLRQLEQVKAENRQLKTVCDKLRSKMMAEKMLKKMLRQQGQDQHDNQVPPSTLIPDEPLMDHMKVDENDCDSDSIYNEDSDENYVSNGL